MRTYSHSSHSFTREMYTVGVFIGGLVEKIHELSPLSYNLSSFGIFVNFVHIFITG